MMPKSLSRSSSKRVKPSHHVSNISGTTSYTNPWPSAGKATWSELLSLSNPLSWYSNHNLHAHERARDVKVVTPDWGEGSLKAKGLESKNGHVVGTWLGHAGVLVELPVYNVQGVSSDTPSDAPLSTNTTSTDTTTSSTPPTDQDQDRKSLYILIDPIFSSRAGPTAYTGPSRMHSSPCTVSSLPGCDFVLISHNHYDHLDATTLKSISKRFPRCKFFLPLGNATSLPSSISKSLIHELDWWQDTEFTLSDLDFPKPHTTPTKEVKIRLTCVPAQHNSGRTGVDSGNALWCGWVMEQILGSTGHDKSISEYPRTRLGGIYHAGDTGYRRHANSTETCPAFREIGERYGPFDLSFLPIWRGGTLGFFSSVGVRLSHHEIPSTFHASPRDAIAIHRDVESRCSLGVHFGTFIGAVEESLEAVIEFDEAGEEAGVARLDEEAGKFGRAGVIDIGGSIVVAVEECRVR